MSAPILRKGVWWHEKRDGTWLRWDAERQTWTPQTDPPPPPEGGKASDEHPPQADMEVFKVVVEHFRHNLTTYWQQFTFFSAIQGALVSVFSNVGSRSESEPTVRAVAIFGFVLALFWWWTAWGRWYLIDKWREEVRQLDLVVDYHSVFYRVEKDVRERPRLIPAFAGLFLPPVIAFGWIALIALV
jgi:hypothetical protein